MIWKNIGTLSKQIFLAGVMVSALFSPATKAQPYHKHRSCSNGRCSAADYPYLGPYPYLPSPYLAPYPYRGRHQPYAPYYDEEVKHFRKPLP